MPPKKRKRIAKRTGDDRETSVNEAALNKAVAARTAGEVEDAEKALRKLSAKGSSGPWASIAGYELALLLSQSGRHAEADDVLQRFGFAFKLNPQILDGSAAATSGAASSKGTPGLVAAFDGALPIQLLEPLREAFGPASPFWPEHDYPTPAFFSYNEAVGAEPSSVESAGLIRALAEHLRPLVGQAFPKLCGEEGSAIASVEWWAHIRQPERGAGHQLHWDLDEAGLASLPPGAPPRHPLVSAVLYLSGPSEGAVGDMAATLVTDQSIDQAAEAKVGWLCPPKANRILMFDGSMLHGVIPRLQGGTAEHAGEPRVTLMLGFWGGSPGPVCQPSGGRLGPNMAMPTKGGDLRWPSVVGGNQIGSHTHKPSESVQLCGPISPVWVQIPAGQEVVGKGAGVEFVGKWFLDHPPATLQERALTGVRQESGNLPTGGGVEFEEVEEVSMEELLRLRESASSGPVAAKKRKG